MLLVARPARLKVLLGAVQTMAFGEALAGVEEVAVDLVGHHQHAVRQADLAQPPQLLRRPDAAHRVVRSGQDQHGHVRLPRQRLQPGEVDGVAAIRQEQWIARQLSLVVGDRCVERIIDRRLDDHPLAGRDEGAHQHVERRHHAGRRHDPLGLDGPAVAAGQPVDHDLAIGGAGPVVAKDAVLGARHQCVDHRLGNREVHICHPHGQQTLTLLQLQRFRQRHEAAVLLDDLPLGGVGARSVDFLVEVVLHNHSTAFSTRRARSVTHLLGCFLEPKLTQVLSV